MTSIDQCALPPTVSRRRVFWTTQPDGCGEYMSCGNDCVIPGLEYIDQDTPYVTGQRGRTIATNDWMRSLLLNILNTKGRLSEQMCKVAVSAVNGHWSESYREDGIAIGTRIWAVGQRPVSRMQDAVALLNATLQADLQKLVKMGVASRVMVTTEYKGKNQVSVIITVHGPIADENVVYLTTERLENEWVWR